MSRAGITDEQKRALLEAAEKARMHAYAPFSGYKVGAAILDKSGQVFAGCNVENSSYGLTICAERNAIAAAVAADCKKPVAIVVVTSDGGMPCGSCRQVLVEFNPAMRVMVATPGSIAKETDAAALLPDYFTLAPKFQPGGI